MFDVVIVGGGPAGLSAALMLGRCRRRVLLFDDGRPRNQHSQALHGYLTRDGLPPSELLALGRAELAKYEVEVRAATVRTIARTERGFTITLASGGIEETKFVLLATGVVDELPAIPGLRECYGRSVFHCPYCDGWERRDQRLAVLGNGSGGTGLALALKTWSRDVVLLTNGGRLDAKSRGRLARNDIDVETAVIDECAHTDGNLREIVFGTHAVRPVDALFFTTGQHPHCDLAETLGCAFNRKGTVETGTLSETNVPGVFVAGDASRDAQFVVVAAAEGVKAALAINEAMQREELRP